MSFDFHVEDPSTGESLMAGPLGAARVVRQHWCELADGAGLALIASIHPDGAVFGHDQLAQLRRELAQLSDLWATDADVAGDALAQLPNGVVAGEVRDADLVVTALPMLEHLEARKQLLMGAIDEAVRGGWVLAIG